MFRKEVAGKVWRLTGVKIVNVTLESQRSLCSDKMELCALVTKIAIIVQLTYE